MTCILQTLPHLCGQMCTPPHQKVSYVTDVNLNVQNINLILLTSSKLHCLCTILLRDTAWEFQEEEEKIYEQQISLKADDDVRYGNGAKVFESLYYCCYQKLVTNFSLCFLAHAYHVAFHQAKTFLSLCMTVVFLMLMDKLACSNSDRNQEVIKEKQQQGRDWVETIYSTDKLLEIVINNQY